MGKNIAVVAPDTIPLILMDIRILWKPDSVQNIHFGKYRKHHIVHTVNVQHILDFEHITGYEY